MDRADRLDRTVLTLLGLLLTGAGIAGLVRGSAAAGERNLDDAVLARDVRSFATDNGALFWPAALVASLLLAWLAWRWLKAHLPRGPEVREIDLTADPMHGETRVLAPAAATAVERDIEEYDGVVAVRARLVRHQPVAGFDLRVDVEDGTDLAMLRRRIEEHALRRFCEAFEMQDVDADVEFRLKPRSGHLVR